MPAQSCEQRLGTHGPYEELTLPLDPFDAATIRAQARSYDLTPEEYLSRLLARAITDAAARISDGDY